MMLNPFTKIVAAQRQSWLVVAVVLCALPLASCITSTAPILGDAKAILGERIEIHMYSHQKDGLHSDGVATLQWNGSRYTQRGGPKLGDFTVHAFEGRDLIVQSSPRPPTPIEYALARRLSDGVYTLIPINEDVADDATRAKFCTKTQDASCRVTTPEQLFVFARATGDNSDSWEGASIAVIVPSARPR